MTDVIVKMCDVRAAGICGPGVRVFFDRYNLDLRDFLHNGIPASRLEQIDDALVKAVLEKAYERYRI